MRGGLRIHASYRRTALVDYALTARLVTIEDLPLLDEEAQRSRQELALSSAAVICSCGTAVPEQTG